MKFETYSEYDPRGIALAASAFLSVWASLGSFHEDLVLVGGLAFDILYTIMNYDGGSQAAIDSIIIEHEADNPAFSDALKCLQIHFENESSPAPIKTAHFLFGEQIETGSEDRRIQRLQIQQQMVDAGRLMLFALKI